MINRKRRIQFAAVATLLQLFGIAVASPAAKHRASSVSQASAEKLARSAAGLDDIGSSSSKAAESGISRAISLSKLEQELEDINVMHKYDRRLVRILMVMPLNEGFEPPVGHMCHGHLQTGDRISMPPSVFREVQKQHLEVPWQFELQRVHRVAPHEYETIKLPAPQRSDIAGKKELPQISRLTCTILDYRAPEQYVFIPDWMMKSMRLKPRDLVRLRYKKLPQSTGVVHLQVHSDSAALAVSVLEEELRHYSSVTAGTTISFIFNPHGVDAQGKAGGSGGVADIGKRKGAGATAAAKVKGLRREVKINVVECIDASGKSVESLCIQDADVRTEWLPPLDVVQKKRKAKEAAEAAQAAAESHPKGRRRRGKAEPAPAKQ